MLEFDIEKLRMKSDEIDLDYITSEGRQIYDELLNAYRILGGGAGLSAPQIGIRKNVFIWTPDRDINTLSVAINPRMDYSGDKILSSEACYSLPGAVYNILRYPHIQLIFYNLQGKRQMKDFFDFEAIVIQHEYDHLYGRIISDHGIKASN